METIDKALQRLKDIELDDDVRFYKDGPLIVMELRNGRNLEISKKEIEYQATEYDNEQLNNIDMKTTIHYVQASDRMIVITKEGSEIVGINYSQGGEIDINTPIDNLLTLYVLDKIECDSIEQIDFFIWDYVNKKQFNGDMKWRINQAIEEMIQNNCESGDVSPYEADKLEEYTNKLADLVAEIVLQNR